MKFSKSLFWEQEKDACNSLSIEKNDKGLSTVVPMHKKRLGKNLEHSILKDVILK